MQIKQNSIDTTELESTFLKGCNESEVFRKARLYVRNVHSRGTDEWYDDK